MPSLPEAPEERGFAREIKFLVPAGQAELIRQWARSRLEPDPHAGGPTDDIYRISSLYFDTPRFDVYCRNGSYGRAKYRIRRYGDSKRVFLDRKLKSRGVVSKRRSIVKVNELGRLENGEPDRDWPGFWFHRRLLLRGLNSICQVSYVAPRALPETRLARCGSRWTKTCACGPRTPSGFATREMAYR